MNIEVLISMRHERDAALARAEALWNALENVINRGKAARALIRNRDGGNWGMLDFSSAETVLNATNPKPLQSPTT